MLVYKDYGMTKLYYWGQRLSDRSLNDRLAFIGVFDKDWPIVDQRGGALCQWHSLKSASCHVSIIKVRSCLIIAQLKLSSSHIKSKWLSSIRNFLYMTLKTLDLVILLYTFSKLCKLFEQNLLTVTTFWSFLLTMDNGQRFISNLTVKVPHYQ